MTGTSAIVGPHGPWFVPRSSGGILMQSELQERRHRVGIQKCALWGRKL